MNFIKQLFLGSGFSKQPWWVIIKTQAPACLYHFGPFDSVEEAEASQLGYLEDLIQEGAQDIHLTVATAVPEKLTVCEYWE